MNTEPIIAIDSLYVSYGKTKAVNGLSLHICAGECFGILGPNGAGKTTTLSCLEGLAQPDRGTITVKGMDAQKERKRVKRLMGVQIQSSSFFPDLTCIELVELFASFHERFPARQERLDYLGRFDLQEKAKAKADELSGGQRQRLALALALVHNPEIVVLDEPTTGLDPQARRTIWGHIRQIGERGHTVILTTHAMEEAEMLCGRVAIIEHGKVIAQDTPANLITRLGTAGTKADQGVHHPQLEDVFLALTGSDIRE
jgi:ABC-2 type transport system ATP-binding protein